MITIEMPSAANGLIKPELDVYHITTDPKTLRNGMWFSVPCITRRHYGLHKWTRIALRQDKGNDYNYGTCGVRFYKGSRGWKNKAHKFENNVFRTIHTHDNGGYWNSSLGCAIIETMTAYKNFFKPLLIRVKKAGQGRDIPLIIIMEDRFIELISKAMAVDGKTVETWQTLGESKEAIIE